MGNKTGLKPDQIQPHGRIVPMWPHSPRQSQHHCIVSVTRPDCSDTAIAGLEISGKDYRFRKVDEALCRLLRYRPGELESSRSLLNVLHPHDLPAVTGQLETVVRGDATYCRIPLRLMTKDGHRLWMILTFESYAGNPGCFDAAFDNITDYMSGQVSVNKNMNLYGSLPEGMPAINADSLNVPDILWEKQVHNLPEAYVDENIPWLIGASEVFQDMMGHVEKIAVSPDTPVLILGETGTGKELVAKAIHYKSPNRTGTFVTLNCAAIPRDLLESELFGYEKGAFSGANIYGKPGLVEQASGGTLFLDEVGDLSVEAQAKLLRFLEEGEYFRIGGNKKLRIRTRVVSATNKNLEKLIEKNLFREDLYHRLAVVKVEIPPLNQRPDDIIPIANYFMKKFSRKFKKRFTHIDPVSEAAMKRYPWRGNIRELRNIIEREVLTGTGPELRWVFPSEGQPRDDIESPSPSSVRKKWEVPEFSRNGVNMPGVLDSLERYYIEEALRESGGNESHAARILNMSYYSFRRHRQKLGL